MKNKDWSKFPVLFSLYIAQSIPMSFFSTVVPVIMRQEHYSLESIGLLQLIKLPWIAKFLWAPVVDNHTRNQKKIKQWIISSELFYALIIIGIGFLNLETSFPMIVGLIILAFIASGTQDIATDIFAIKVLDKEERSLGNSMQSAGSFIGSLFGTGVLLVLFYYFGWKNLLYLLAIFVIIAILPVLFYKQPENENDQPKTRVRISDILLFFSGKARLKHLLLLVFYYSGLIGILAMLKPYLVDLGYNVKEIGFMSGIVGTSTAVLCSFLAGFVVKKIGRKPSFYVFALINIAAALYFYFMSQQIPTLSQIYTGICLLWGAYGLSTVIIYTSCMDKVRKDKEGTDFTIQIVITHLSSLIIAVFSGKIGDQFHYSGVFISEFLLGIIALGLVFLNYPLMKRRNGIQQNID